MPVIAMQSGSHMSENRTSNQNRRNDPPMPGPRWGLLSDGGAEGFGLFAGDCVLGGVVSAGEDARMEVSLPVAVSNCWPELTTVVGNWLPCPTETTTALPFGTDTTP